MNPQIDDSLRRRVLNLKAIPTVPAILSSVLQALDLPPDQIEVEKVTQMISHDNSIAAQCLRMANSALFMRPSPIETIRGAVVALGARRLRDILWSSFLTQMAPTNHWPLNATSFWEHSFGCALVTQQFAKKLALPDPERFYLSALLHDIGELVNSTLLPEPFTATTKSAISRRISLFEAERETLGFTHCETGKLLAEHWNLPAAIQTVIEYHHTPEKSPAPDAIVAVVNLSDYFCRLRGMGYGYDDLAEVQFSNLPAWELLKHAVPTLEEFDIVRFTMELDSDAEEIRHLVAATFAH
jgi:HD-like signal output (HDOD) protein